MNLEVFVDTFNFKSRLLCLTYFSINVSHHKSLYLHLQNQFFHPLTKHALKWILKFNQTSWGWYGLSCEIDALRRAKDLFTLRCFMGPYFNLSTNNFICSVANWETLNSFLQDWEPLERRYPIGYWVEIAVLFWSARCWKRKWLIFLKMSKQCLHN